MTKTESLTILALIIGPILAVQIQKFIEWRGEQKKRKKLTFFTLMATRAAKLSPQHVEALNRIDIDFYDNDKVKQSWKTLLDNFEHCPQDVNDLNYSTLIKQWSDKSEDLLIDLLYEMAISLNYKFDKVHLKRKVYMPKGHVDFENENVEMRKAILGILRGNNSIPIKVIEKNSNQDMVCILADGLA